MDPLTDPNLITVKVTIPGPGGEAVIRKFKVTHEQLQKDAIHNTVIIHPPLFVVDFKLTWIYLDGTKFGFEWVV